MERKPEKIEDLLAVPIQLTESLRRLANDADSYRQECTELKLKAEALAQRLRDVACVSRDGAGGLYMRPLCRITQELQKSLGKAFILVRKCSRNGVIKRLITITSAHDFKRVNVLLDNAIADMTWFFNISSSGGESGMPPIASSDPMMGFCWVHIALLLRGTEEQKEEAANQLCEVARNNERNAKIIVEEEAVTPLLKVLMDGTLMACEAAARALGYMAKDADIVKQMIQDGVAPVLVKVLNGAPMRVQASAAWALAEMVHVDLDQQDLFLEHLAIRRLVALLAETLEEPGKTEPVSMHTLMSSMAATKPTLAGQQQDIATHVPKPSNRYMTQQGLGYKPDKSPLSSLSPPKSGIGVGTTQAAEQRNGNLAGRAKSVGMENGRGLTQRELNRRERENEDPEIKAELKAEVARALWMLAKGNPKTSKSITETKALLCFATLMEKGTGAVQWNSVMAVMEIAAVAEMDVDLKRAAFKMSSPAAKAVVDQLLRLVEGAPELQVACIKAIGCLSRTFPARETRVVKPLVKQLECPDTLAAEEAVMALEKFACEDNFLHLEHSRAIIEASGAFHLVQMIYFGKGQAQLSAAALMCYLALHVKDSEELAKAEPLPALKGFAKNLSQYPLLEKLVNQAIMHLEIYQSKSLRKHPHPFY